MDSAIIATIVTTVVGGVFLLLQKYVENRYTRAREAVEKNSAEVQNMTQVVDGFKTLNEEYRTTIEEKDRLIDEKDKKIREQRAEILSLKGKSK